MENTRWDKRRLALPDTNEPSRPDKVARADFAIQDGPTSRSKTKSHMIGCGPMGETNHPRLWLALRLVLPIAALTYLFTLVPILDVARRLTELPPHVLVMALLFYFAGLWIAAVRWKLLLRSLPHGKVPSLGRLFRLYWVGAFYNTCLPGGVGGDVVRAAGIRTAHLPASTTTALAVVFVERVLGLGGLILLATAAFAINPLPGAPLSTLISGLGFAVVIATIVLAYFLPRFSERVPVVLRKVVRRLPRFDHPRPLVVGLVLSVVTNLSMVAIGHLFVAAMTPVHWMDSLVIVPLANLAAVFPLAIGGIGVREGAFVALYGLVGVQPDAALAASLALYGCLVLGGALAGFLPLRQTLEKSLRTANLREKDVGDEE